MIFFSLEYWKSRESILIEKDNSDFYTVPMFVAGFVVRERLSAFIRLMING